MRGLIQLKKTKIFCEVSFEEMRKCAEAGGTAGVVPAKQVSSSFYLLGVLGSGIFH